MSLRKQQLIFLLQLVLVTGTAYAQSSDPESGREILKQYKKDLQSALQSGMSKGFQSAIQTCRIEAPSISRSHSQGGVKVGRTSHRLRNKNNAPPAWVEPIMNEYVSKPAAWQPRHVTLSGGRTGYVEPIVMQPLCASCHGNHIAAGIAAQIDSIYPDDEAVGFEVGELRGVFWIEY